MSLNGFVKHKEKKKAKQRVGKASKEDKKLTNDDNIKIVPRTINKWNPQWFRDFSKSELYDFLRKAAESSPLFANHVVWTRNVLLAQTPEPEPQDVASLLGISLGEAYIILDKIFKKDEQSI